MEFNGALCRGLKEARYREKPPDESELTLVDFFAADRGGSGPSSGASRHLPPRGEGDSPLPQGEGQPPKAAG